MNEYKIMDTHKHLSILNLLQQITAELEIDYTYSKEVKTYDIYNLLKLF